MKIIILSRYYKKGGAAIAAKRLYDALEKKNTFLYSFVTPQIIETSNSFNLFSKKYLYRFYEKIIFKLDTLFFILIAINKPLRSFNFFGLINAKYFNKEKELGIINVHWINGGCISLKNISKIKKTLILTLHDSWLINGTSHYPTSVNQIFENKFNKLQIYFLKIIEKKFKIYKRNKLNNISCIIVPSTWLYDLLLIDNYFNKFPIYKIPNPINLDIYKPINKPSISESKFKIIAYFEDKYDILKGSDLLYNLIQQLEKFKNIEFHLIGNNFENNDLKAFANVVSYGYIIDENKLVEIYNNSNLCISTSRSENLSQFLTQACACGLPLIAFDIGGNSDIINHGKNGFLISDFDINIFSTKILELQANNELLNLMRINSINISKNWDSDIIASAYEEIFKKYNNAK